MPVTVGGAPPDPGYSAKKARLIQTGPDGQPVYTLDAVQIQQQPEQGTVDMQQVELGFRTRPANSGRHAPRTGNSPRTAASCSSTGSVHVTGIVPGTEEAADITTEHLAFDTNAQVVTTRDPVTLLMTGRKLDAHGMVANLKERHVQLESAVHGTYSP